MKTIFILTFFVICATQLCVIEGAHIRQKRSIHREECSENFSVAQCEAYAKRRSEKEKGCHTYGVTNQVITWQHCGTAYCILNAKLVPEDMSKPFPQCCETCTIKDKTKPFEAAQTL